MATREGIGKIDVLTSLFPVGSPDAYASASPWVNQQKIQGQEPSDAVTKDYTPGLYDTVMEEQWVWGGEEKMSNTTC